MRKKERGNLWGKTARFSLGRKKTITSVYMLADTGKTEENGKVNMLVYLNKY